MFPYLSTYILQFDVATKNDVIGIEDNKLRGIFLTAVDDGFSFMRFRLFQQ